MDGQGAGGRESSGGRVSSISDDRALIKCFVSTYEGYLYDPLICSSCPYGWSPRPSCSPSLPLGKLTQVDTPRSIEGHKTTFFLISTQISILTEWGLRGSFHIFKEDTYKRNEVYNWQDFSQ